MLIAPAVLALNGVAVTTTLSMLLAAAFALRVARHWNITSGSELQLELERKTYLIATLVAWCFVATTVSLLLFVYNAERMSTQIVGAMCATGVLNANPWGWPTLLLKIAVFFAGAAWLMLNRIDNLAPDYPLIRAKYCLLLAIAPLVALEAAAQLKFFLELDPNVITSCCGALFTPAGDGVAATLAALDPATSLAAMYASGILVFGLGAFQRNHRKDGTAVALAGTLAFAAALTAIVSCIALYVYEHPHHHCPFCILKSGHGFIGYWMYVPLFAATALTLGVGLINQWHRTPSLMIIIRAEGRRYTSIGLVLFAVFYGSATYALLSSNLRMMDPWW